jgi:transcriptional regulator with XRE-family HTH domain
MERTRQLNVVKVRSLMDEKGINQADLARQLDVSRTTVSNWLTKLAMPKPRHLGKMALLFRVLISDLIDGQAIEPSIVYSFRKSKNFKVPRTYDHLANDAGRALDLLEPYLNKRFKMMTPHRLREFTGSYDEYQELVKDLRNSIDKSLEEPLDYKDIACIIEEFDINVIPVLWGNQKKDFPIQAIHIHSTHTELEWMYFNIEIPRLHFKFMASHELFHALSKNLNLNRKIGDQFAEKFAQALLFPEPLAKEAYTDLSKKKRWIDNRNVLFRYAKELSIHPYQVYKAANNFAEEHNEKLIPPFGKNYLELENFVDNQGLLINELFGGKALHQITQSEYIQTLQEEFCTPIFTALREYAKRHPDALRITSTILFMSLADAAGLIEFWDSDNATTKDSN